MERNNLSIKPSNTIGLIIILLEVGLLGIALGLSSLGGYFWIVGQGLLAISMYHFFCILHDCGHGIFFRYKPLNTWVGCFSSLVCGVPYYPWKYMHRDHHYWTGWADMDPLTENKRPKYRLTEKVVNFFWKYNVPVFAFFYVVKTHYNPLFFFRHIRGEGKRLRCIASIFGILLFWGALAVVLKWQYVHYFLLAFVVFQYISDFMLVSNHSGISKTTTHDQTVHPFEREAHGNYSRNLEFPNWIERFVFLYSNRHAVHHRYPDVPLYRYHKVSQKGIHDTHWLSWLRRSRKIPGVNLIYDHSETIDFRTPKS